MKFAQTSHKPHVYSQTIKKMVRRYKQKITDSEKWLMIIHNMIKKRGKSNQTASTVSRLANVAKTTDQYEKFKCINRQQHKALV